jgi:hypothetical protein
VKRDKTFDSINNFDLTDGIILQHYISPTINNPKIDVVGRGERKKDFWDLHELLETYSIAQMLQLHKERYPYSHNKEEILSNFSNFKNADADFDPICLRNKY